MLRTFDNIILSFRRQYVKECAVAGHSHNQISVILWMLLGVQKRFPVHHIILHVISFQHIEEGAQHQNQLLNIPVLLHGLRRKLLIQQNASVQLQSRKLGYGLEYGRRAVYVCAVGGGTALSQRLPIFPPVRSCAKPCSLGNIGGDRGGRQWVLFHSGYCGTVQSRQ